MAEKSDKPGVKITSGEMSGSKVTEEVVTIFAIMIIGGAVATALLSYLTGVFSGEATGFLGMIKDYFFANIWPVWKVIAVVVSAAAAYGIVHNLNKLQAINIEEKPIFDPASAPPDIRDDKTPPEKKDERWENILKLSNSGNPSDWRLAIIEADVMLEDMLRISGYIGDSVGDMLKSADKSDFLTLDNAWEAHKVRNDIAHTGSTYQLNERETKRVITLYDSVFREFRLI